MISAQIHDNYMKYNENIHKRFACETDVSRSARRGDVVLAKDAR